MISVFGDAHTKRTGVLLIVLLCLCLGIQTLGLPVAMWSLWEESDTSESADFSIPPTIPQLNPSTFPTRLEMIQQSLRVPLLVSAVFHPPKSLR